MGPLEKLKAFGLRMRDVPSAAYMGIKDSFDKNFPDHAVAYDMAANELYAQAGAHSPEYNRAKGHFGGLDYMLRYARTPEDAAKIARLYQLKQAMFRDPKQDLLDLEANLAGIQEGAQLRGKVKPDDYDALLERSRAYADKMRNQ